MSSCYSNIPNSFSNTSSKAYKESEYKCHPHKGICRKGRYDESKLSEDEDQNLICMALVRENGTTVDVFDINGQIRTFSSKNIDLLKNLDRRKEAGNIKESSTILYQNEIEGKIGLRKRRPLGIQVRIEIFIVLKMILSSC